MVTTFSDAVAQLSDSYTFKVGKDRIGRLAKKAVGIAIVDMSGKAEWFYLRKQAQINITGCYSTGTVGFDATTRILTLSGGVFPTNSVQCDLLMNRNFYLVETRTDDTHLVLRDGSCPASDVPTGTSYALAKTKYTLPADYVQLRGLTEVERFWRLVYVSPEVMLAQSQLWFTPTNSWYYTITGGNNGRMVMQFSPPPSLDRTLYIDYQGQPRPRTLTDVYSTGRVTTTAGSTTVTIADGILPSGVSDGNIFRLGSDVVPTGIYGDYPYVEERRVKSRTDDTHLETWEPMEHDASGVCWSVDDPIDINNLYQSYFDRLCEARLSRLHKTGAEAVASEQAAEWELQQARAADSRMNPSANVGFQSNISLAEGFFFAAVPVPP